MKARSTIIKRVTMLLLLLVAKSAFSQAPTYNVYITNECYPTNKTYRFDIWLQKTGSGTLDIANIAFALDVNQPWRGTATITPSIVSGSSMFSSGETPEGVSGIVTYNNNAVSSSIDRINITARANPGCGSGTIIPDAAHGVNSGTACNINGIRFCTVLLTSNGTSWPAGVTPNLHFNSLGVQTLVSYYPQPCPSNGDDATNQGTYIDYTTSGTCTANPAGPGCTQITATTAAIVTNPSCSNTNGSFTISNTFPALTNGNVRYSINGGSYTVTATSSSATTSSRTFTTLGRGIYMVKIERGASLTTTGCPSCTTTPICIATIAVTLGQGYSPVTAVDELTGSPIPCAGGTTTVTIHVAGGAVPYSDGSNSFSSPTIDETVPAGAYSFTITDACGSSATVSGTITEPPAVVINSLSSTNASCSNCTNGSITVSASGGTGALQYSITGDTVLNNDASGATTGSFTSVQPDHYTVIATDNNGCIAQDTISVRVNAVSCNITATAISTNVSCFGGSNGTATASASGAVGSVSYLWSNGATTNPASGLSAGTYTVTVTDNGTANCTATATATVNQPSALSASSSSGSIACNGGNTTVNVTASGGTGPYSGTGTFTRTAGSYSFTVTDNNGCTASTSITISQPTAVTASSSSGSIACNGGSTTVAVTASGGTTPYSGTGSFTRTAGSYSFIVTDNNGCTATTSITITQPTAVTATSSSGSIACNGGSTTVTVTASGGTIPYSGTGNFTRTAGSYSFIVTDNNGCTATTSITITQPTAVTATSSSGSIACNGGSTTVTVTASGGTTPYSGTGNFTRTAGSYSFIVTDNHGCTATTSITITQPTAVTASSSSGSIACNGGSTTVTVTASGGTAPYSGTGSFSRTAGSYSFVVTDNHGCTATTTITVTQPTAVTASSSSGAIACNGGSTTITVSASGGTAPYSGTGTFTRTAGSYSFTVTDNNGCTASTSITITQPALVTISASNNSPVCSGNINLSSTVTGITACNGTNWTVSAGPSDLVFSPASLTITLGDSVTFALASIHDAVEVSQADWNNNVNNPLAGGFAVAFGGGIVLPANLPVGTHYYICQAHISFGMKGTITVLPCGASYSWTGPNGFTATTQNTTVAGNASNSGTYTVTVTNSSGCSATSTTTVSQPSALSAASCSGSIACNGGSTTITVTASGGTSPYSGTGSFTRTAGSYYFTVTDAHGCTASTSITITQPSALTANCGGTAVTTNGGNNGTASVTASGGSAGYTYHWNTGATTSSISGLTAANYCVTVTDNASCSASCCFNVTQPNSVNVTCGGTPVSCNGGSNGSASVTASGGVPGYTYHWNNGATTTSVSNLTAGTYSVTVTDSQSATNTCSFTVTQPTAVTASASSGTISCNGGSTTVTVTASGGTSPYTGTGSFTRTAGSYSFIVTDSHGCTGTTSITVTQPSALTASSSSGSIACNGGSTSVNVSASGGTAPYSGTGSFTRTAGSYSFIVTDNNGCTATTSITITQPTAVTASSSSGSVACNGGSTTVTVTASGGTAPYSGTGSFTRTAGSYSFVVTDNNGCTATTSITITQPTALTASSSVVSNVSCNGGSNGSAAVGVTGGTSPYSGTGTFSGLTAGTYTYVVTDAHGCTASTSVTISQPTAITASSSSGSIACNGGSTTVTVTASGGTAPYSGTGSFTRTAGAYSFIVTDNHGCTATTSITITQPTALSVTASAPATVCTGSALNLSSTVSGGTAAYTYAWSGPASFSSTSPNPSIASAAAANSGTYTLVVTDAHGCSGSATATVTVQSCSSTITLNITAYLEGLYISSHTMKTPLHTLFGNGDATASDTIEVDLWETNHTGNSSPDFSTKVIIHSNGTAAATFTDNGSIAGHSLYIAIKHRNHLETWSKNPVAFSTTTSYDFSTAQTQAFDDGINYNLPMRNMGGGVFAFYAGDVNGDGIVDLTDMQVVDNDTQIGAFGYNRSDISGNGATGIEDMAFIDNDVNVYSNPPLTMSRPH